MKVFVYGTLKDNESNNRILKGVAEKLSNGVVRDFKLYNTGFPVAIPNDGTLITGEVWEIGNPDEDDQARNTLNRLDWLEGYDAASHSGMYTREEVTVYASNGETYECGMYVGGPTWRNGLGMRECPYDINDNTYTWSR